MRDVGSSAACILVWKKGASQSRFGVFVAFIFQSALEVYGACRYIYVAIPSFLFLFSLANTPYVHESGLIDDYDNAI